MARTLPVLVVASLLAFAPIVAAVPSAESVGQPSTAPGADSVSLQTQTRVTDGLSLDTVGASNVTTAKTDASSLLDVQASELQGQFETYRFEEQIGSLDSRDAQRDVLRQELSNVSERLDDLKAEERRARLAYVDGELTAQEFVVALARVGAKAKHTDAKLTYIQEQMGNTFPNVVRTELRPLRPEIRALRGPVRAHAIDVLRGESASNRLYVAASENGTRLSMFQGRIWVSQTTRWDNFDRAVHSVGDIEAVVSSGLGEIHPELNFSQIVPEIGSYGDTRSLFSASAIFDYGQINGYLDGSTGSLFYEEQELFLDSLPNDATEQRLGDDLVVTVNRTYAGGPLQVSLTNRTGRPLDGEVRIAGEPVGSTGFDGTLWALGRPGTYDVTVVYEGQRIEMEVSAVSPEG